MSEMLWAPGRPLPLDEYPPCNQERLIGIWQQANPEQSVRSVRGVLGVVAQPNRPPTRVASVDLCEVVRHTHLATAAIAGKTRADILDFRGYAATLGLRTDQESIVAAAVVALMNADLVPPVENIAAIRNFMQRWRQQNVLVVANTSTLPACEEATVKFLTTYLPDCFDGIVFPRNHDGLGRITKAAALRMTLQTIGAIPIEYAIHIDDTPHHIDALHRNLGSFANAGTGIMPLYPGVIPPAGAVCTESPLEAFMIADAYLRAMPETQTACAS